MTLNKYQIAEEKRLRALTERNKQWASEMFNPSKPRGIVPTEAQRNDGQFVGKSRVSTVAYLLHSLLVSRSDTLALGDAALADELNRRQFRSVRLTEQAIAAAVAELASVALLAVSESENGARTLDPFTPKFMLD
jgi:hypothetical protein